MVRFNFNGKGSRKERLEQAKREKQEADQTRRRNFGFLNSGEKRMSTVSLNKSREHSKQLALAMDPVPTPTSQASEFIPEWSLPPPSNTFNAHEEVFDPFQTASLQTRKQTVSSARQGSLLDQHFDAFPSEREPTASTQDSFDTSSFGSSAYDMDFFKAPAATAAFGSPSNQVQLPNRNRKPLDQFVQETRLPPQGPSSYSGASFDRSTRGERSVISMPTMPTTTNNAMQSPPAASAAARRRMRNQMRLGSNSSVVSEDASSTSSPPESPASSAAPPRSAPSSASKNRLLPYQANTSGSFYSQASSTNNSQNSFSQHSGSDSNLFDSHVVDGGFTFDAFGLDQSQVEREVNEAMKDLAGQGVSGFSVFFNNDSDGEFPSQNWDSPANSRRSSPVPSDSDTDGFEDGFKVARATPARHALDRSFSPASKPFVGGRSHPRGTTTPPRWEGPSTKRVEQNAFDSFSNPWKQDPWGSGDEGNGSESGNNSDFGGTKSEILSSSISAQPRYTGDSKSDIGVPTSFKSVSFRHDVVLPPIEPSPRNMDDSSDSDESGTMQEELAKEFAQDLVQRISPRHQGSQNRFSPTSRSPTSRSPTSRSPSYNQSQPADQHVVYQEYEQQEQYDDSEGADVSGNLDSFQDYVDIEGQSDSDDYGHSQHEQQLVQEPPQRAPVETPEPAQSRFASFRSRYESKKGLTSPDYAAPEPQMEEAPAAPTTIRNQQSKFTSPAPQPEQDACQPDFLPENTSAEAPSLDEGHSAPVEEKKEDEGPVAPTPQKGSLAAKWKQWENKSASPVPQQPAKKWTRPNRLPTPEETALASVELLTPEIVEARRQERRSSRSDELRTSAHEEKPFQAKLKSVAKTPPPASTLRAEECQTERGSFASLRERLKPSASTENKAKSEGGAAFKATTTSAAMDRLRQNSPRFKTNVETKSDTGTPPSFLGGVKLRKTGAVQEETTQQSVTSPLRSPEANVTPTKNEAMENEEPSKPVERKLTYRERRELELKRQEQEKSKLEAVKQKEPKMDVAALIRKRIAANKQASKDSEPVANPLSQARGGLKPVAAPSPVTSPKLGVPSPRSLKPVKSPVAEATPSKFGVPSPRSLKPVSSPHATATPLRNAPGPSENEPTNDNDNQKVFSGLTPLKNDMNADAPDDEGLLDVLSPTSAGTNMTYSTDGSTKDRFLKPQASPGRDTLPETPAHDSPTRVEEPPVPELAANPLEKLFAGRAAAMTPPVKALKSKAAASAVANLFVSRAEASAPPTPEPAPAPVPTPVNKPKFPALDGDIGKNDVKAMLSGFLGARNNPLGSLPAPKKEADTEALMYAKRIEEHSPEKKRQNDTQAPLPPAVATHGHPALKDDPKYERYFRMLKVGMPMEVVKHAMLKDGNDPDVMDGDHNLPAGGGGVPLKEDPAYAKYFKMLKLGMPLPVVKHAMARDGMNPDVMDQDHNLPVSTAPKQEQKPKEPKDTHRRARLHWKTLQKVTRNSLWSKIEKEPEGTEVDFDEDEFNELFKADLGPSKGSPKKVARKGGAAVRVIDAKRANNGGIILARVKMSHDEMADVVDRIDGDALTAEQIQNIIEYLPTKEERVQLEKYMLEGGQDAAEKFDGLCECEKFMVSMMTVKHAKRKVRALLFKLQFMDCLRSIAEDAGVIEEASDQLKNSTRLRQLLGIVLQFGNRLNTAGKSSKRKAGAFTLDSLLKLSQAKAFDKKTTFLHYVVMIVHRNNEILLNFTDDLPTVVKADKVYWDQCLQDLEEVENQLENVRRISLYEARSKQQYRLNNQNDDDSLADIELTLEEEVEALRATPTGMFTLSAIKQVSSLRDKVEATRSKFVKVLEYFGEDDDSMQPHELFNIFTVFGRDFNKAKEEAFENMKKKRREERKKNGRDGSNATKGQTTPKKGKPPSTPERSIPLRASSLQPNMSKVINDFKASGTSPHRKTNTTPAQPRSPVSSLNQAQPSTSSHQNSVQNRQLHTSTNQVGTKFQQRVAPQQQSGFESRRPDSAREGYTPSNYLQSSTPPPAPKPIASPKKPDAVYRTPVENGSYAKSYVPTTAYSGRNGFQTNVPRGMQETGELEEVSASVPSSYAANPVSEPEANAAESLRQKARMRRQRQLQTSDSTSSSVTPEESSQTMVEESRSPRSSPNNSLPDDSSVGKSPSLTSRQAMRHKRLQAMKRTGRLNSSSHSRSSAHSRSVDWPESSDVSAS
eukprot:Nitzschia sp. Nitz4//scaffold30_size153850//116218//122960//NITZ4_002791-RA/size153850-augustus-gene-0.63-mRNA-1//1//CDS//3329547303//8408//frame0